MNEYGEALLGSSQEFGSIFQSEDGIIPHLVQDWKNLKRGAFSGVLTGWWLEQILSGRTTSTGRKVSSHRAEQGRTGGIWLQEPWIRKGH